MKHRMTTLLTMFGSVALLISVICAKPVVLYVWNASESAPLGLYRLQPVDTLFVSELVAVLRRSRLLRSLPRAAICRAACQC